MKTGASILPHQRSPRPVPEIGAENSLREALRIVLNTILGYAREQAKEAIRQRSPERIHDYRVAIRILRTHVGSFQDAFSGAERKLAEVHLRTLVRNTGELRDLDVLLDARQELTGRVPKRFRSALLLFFKPLEARRDTVRREVLAQFRSPEHRNAFTALKQGLVLPDPRPPAVDRPIRAALGETLRRRRKRMEKQARKFRKNPCTTHLHSLRIAAKKLRYLIETFQKALPAAACRNLLKELKTAQDSLGRAHDLEFQRMAVLGALGEWSANEHPGEEDVARAASRLAAALLREEKTARRAALSAGRTLTVIRFAESFEKLLRSCRTASASSAGGKEP